RTHPGSTLFPYTTLFRSVGTLEYRSDLFEAGTAARMARHLLTLLEGIVDDPARRVSDLPLLSRAEWQELMIVRNDTEQAYPEESDRKSTRLNSSHVSISY